MRLPTADVACDGSPNPAGAIEVIWVKPNPSPTRQRPVHWKQTKSILFVSIDPGGQWGADVLSRRLDVGIYLEVEVGVNSVKPAMNRMPCSRRLSYPKTGRQVLTNPDNVSLAVVDFEAFWVFSVASGSGGFGATKVFVPQRGRMWQPQRAWGKKRKWRRWSTNLTDYPVLELARPAESDRNKAPLLPSSRSQALKIPFIKQTRSILSILYEQSKILGSCAFPTSFGGGFDWFLDFDFFLVILVSGCPMVGFCVSFLDRLTGGWLQQCTLLRCGLSVLLLDRGWIGAVHCLATCVHTWWLGFFDDLHHHAMNVKYLLVSELQIHIPKIGRLDENMRYLFYLYFTKQYMFFGFSYILFTMERLSMFWSLLFQRKEPPKMEFQVTFSPDTGAVIRERKALKAWWVPNVLLYFANV